MKDLIQQGKVKHFGIGATNVELLPKDLRELETAASKIAVQGARYPEELQKMVGRL